MIRITVFVDNPSIVTQIYNRVRVYSCSTIDGTYAPITNLVPSEIVLLSSTSSYTAIDYDGTETTWYISQYYSTDTLLESSWSSPVLGEVASIYYNPLYPQEVSYGSEDQAIINRIRVLIGDPVYIRRTVGEDALSSVHDDLKTFELNEKGWPADVHIAGEVFNSIVNPSVNGYKYLKFNSDITVTELVTVSGSTNRVQEGIDIWWYTFRHSDREIMEAYSSCPPPGGLTVDTANEEAYKLATAIDLLTSELWLDATEDGAKVGDEASTYDPTPGLNVRRQLLDGLRKKLDDLEERLLLCGITGVRID